MYKLKTVTRIQEGASFEDIQNGDAYETAYLIIDETGNIIVDTTNEDVARSYLEDEYIPCAENGDYSPSNPWCAPGMKISDFI